jgi:hypothetical protein
MLGVQCLPTCAVDAVMQTDKQLKKLANDEDFRRNYLSLWAKQHEAEAAARKEELERQAAARKEEQKRDGASTADQVSAGTCAKVKVASCLLCETPRSHCRQVLHACRRAEGCGDISFWCSMQTHWSKELLSQRCCGV